LLGKLSVGKWHLPAGSEAQWVPSLRVTRTAPSAPPV